MNPADVMNTMGNGFNFAYVGWMKYVGLIWLWGAMIVGGAGLGLYFRKTTGGVAMGWGMMAIGTVILFKWVNMI